MIDDREVFCNFPFVLLDLKTPASRTDKEQAWASLKQIRQMCMGPDDKGKMVFQGDYKASWYANKTKVRIPDKVIDQRLDAKIAEFKQYLNNIFPDVNEFPPNVQLALLDMVYNLGPTNLVKKFPNFCKAIRERRWMDAAKESRRGAISPARNEFVATLLRSSAAALG